MPRVAWWAWRAPWLCRPGRTAPPDAWRLRSTPVARRRAGSGFVPGGAVTPLAAQVALQLVGELVSGGDLADVERGAFGGVDAVLELAHHGGVLRALGDELV